MTPLDFCGAGGGVGAGVWVFGAILVGSLGNAAGFSDTFAGSDVTAGFTLACFGASTSGADAFCAETGVDLAAALALLADDVVVLSPLDAAADLTSDTGFEAVAGAAVSVLAGATGVLGGVLVPLDETGFFGFATPFTFRF